MENDQPHVRLLRDHQELEVYLQDLLSAFDGGDRSVATRAFQAFDRRLSAHLAFEEDVLFPAFAAVDPAEAAELTAEHAAIRRRVEHLAIEDNLHLSRARQIHELVDALRAHARREETTLYRLADRLAEDRALRTRLDDLTAPSA